MRKMCMVEVGLRVDYNKSLKMAIKAIVWLESEPPST